MHGHGTCSAGGTVFADAAVGDEDRALGGRNVAAARQPVGHQAGEEPHVPQEEQGHYNKVSFYKGEG